MSAASPLPPSGGGPGWGAVLSRFLGVAAILLVAGRFVGGPYTGLSDMSGIDLARSLHADLGHFTQASEERRFSYASPREFLEPLWNLTVRGPGSPPSSGSSSREGPSRSPRLRRNGGS